MHILSTVPGAKDITGDLYRLHGRRQEAGPPPLRGRNLSRRRARKLRDETAAPTRRLRFEPFTLFAWTATGAFILGQAVIIYWLAQ